METTASHKPKIEIVSDSEDLANNCLKIFVNIAQNAIKKKDKFFVAISGGNTPKRFFELLAEKNESLSLDWGKIHLFWVDERYVPYESKWSNYKLASDTFLGKVGIPGRNVHSIPTNYNDSGMAASEYETIISEAFSLKKGQIPHFDLIILGMGPDGHTGSLFPNSYALFDTSDLACVVYVFDEKLNRITLTSPVLKAAENMVVLVSGEEKSEILKKVFTSEPDEACYPIHVLWPVLDKVTWLVDSNAAKSL